MYETQPLNKELNYQACGRIGPRSVFRRCDDVYIYSIAQHTSPSNARAAGAGAVSFISGFGTKIAIVRSHPAHSTKKKRARAILRRECI